MNGAKPFNPNLQGSQIPIGVASRHLGEGVLISLLPVQLYCDATIEQDRKPLAIQRHRLF